MLRDEPVRAVPKPPTAAKRNARNRGKYHEKRVAETTGGRQTISSGRTAVEKGDVRVDDIFPHLFLEVKYVGERQGRALGSVSFEREWMTKTLLDAEAVGCLPLVAMRFADGHGVYCAEARTFEALIRALRDAQAQAKALEEALIAQSAKKSHRLPDTTRAGRFA
jgi:hypothetical protein